MDLYESNDQKKMELLTRSSKHRQGVEDEVKLISERTQSILTNALIVGGTLAATYFLARQMSRRNSKRKGRIKKVKIVPSSTAHEGVHHGNDESESPGVMSQISTALLSQATIFLLGFAKQKLSQYLQSPVEKKAEDNEHP